MTNKVCDMNYCFWAKLLVAIPVFPIAAVVAASFFTNPAVQIVIAGVAIAVVIVVSKWLDRLPALQRPVFKRKS